MGRRRRRARRRSGLQEGVWSYWFKMKFSLIYLFSWAHSSRLSACFLLYVPWPQCPLPPSSLCVFNVSVSASANMCACVCLWVRISILSLLSLHVCLCTLYLVWSESLSWCLGMNGIFWDRSVLLCVCQTRCASMAHTRKATSPWLLLCTMPENSSDYAGHSRVRTRAVLS